MSEQTFQELYCAQHNLKPEQYEKAVFKKTLYLHARFLAPFIRLFWPRHFAADVEFVLGVGQLRRYRDYFSEAEDFTHHPENRGFWRMMANVRVSSRRMRRLVRTTLHTSGVTTEGEEEHSAAPFRAKRDRNSMSASGDGKTGMHS